MPNPAIREINQLNFESEVLSADGVFLLEFGAPWCSPCIALEPIVTQVAQDLTGKLRVGKVDVDDSPALTAQLQVRAFPTLIVFAAGKERARRVGMMNRQRVLELVGELG